jgi:hypothetical protein
MIQTQKSIKNSNTDSILDEIKTSIESLHKKARSYSYFMQSRADRMFNAIKGQSTDASCLNALNETELNYKSFIETETNALKIASLMVYWDVYPYFNDVKKSFKDIKKSFNGFSKCFNKNAKLVNDLYMFQCAWNSYSNLKTFLEIKTERVANCANQQGIKIIDRIRNYSEIFEFLSSYMYFTEKNMIISYISCVAGVNRKKKLRANLILTECIPMVSIDQVESDYCSTKFSRN